MDDGWKYFLRLILGYLPDFTDVLAHPSDFVLDRSRGGRNNLDKAGSFWVLSVLLASFLLYFGMDYDKVPLRAFLINEVVVFVIFAPLMALVFWLSWRLVGGKAGLVNVLIGFCYHAGVGIVVFNFLIICGVAVLRAKYAQDYCAVCLAGRAANLGQVYEWIRGTHPINPPFLIDGLFTLCGIIFIATWTITIWGVYRNLNGLSRGRGFAAFLVFVPFWTLFIVGLYNLLYLIKQGAACFHCPTG